MKTTISQDAENFLVALLWAYPADDEGNNPMDEKSIYDFSPEFISAVEKFCESFREYLAAREIEIPVSANSFGGNVYFSLSGHGVGFWDSDETAHLQPHIEAFSGDHYRFEQIDLSEDENGELDLSFLPEFVAGYRAKMFTPAK